MNECEECILGECSLCYKLKIVGLNQIRPMTWDLQILVFGLRGAYLIFDKFTSQHSQSQSQPPQNPITSKVSPNAHPMTTNKQMLTTPFHHKNSLSLRCWYPVGILFIAILMKNAVIKNQLVI